MTSRRLVSRLAALAVASVLMAGSAVADTTSDVRSLYLQFVSAQNAGDLGKVRSLLLDSPKFFWITDGRAVWGPDAALVRMGLFQQSEIWHVDPDLDLAEAIELGQDAALLHLPLVLSIGSKSPGPDRLRFLVEVVCRKTAQGWRIAALLTTTDKSGV